jgi:hypothetical protein
MRVYGPLSVKPEPEIPRDAHEEQKGIVTPEKLTVYVCGVNPLSAQSVQTPADIHGPVPPVQHPHPPESLNILLA